MATRFRNTLFFMCGMAAVLTMTSAMTGCTSEQTEPDARRMAEQGAVTFAPSMALTAHWGMPEADDWGTTRGFATEEGDGVAVIRFAGSRPMEAAVTRGSRYEGNDVEGQSYQTLKASDTFRVSGYRYDPSKGETVADVAEPNFFDNAKVSYIGKWQATGSYYIPTVNDRTDFFAWFVPSGTEGVSLSGNKSGGLKLDYSVPATVSKQPDLLTAVSRGDEYSDDPAHMVPLSFSHQLTEVNFVVGEELSPGTITEIAFTNVGMAGTLDVGSGKWTVTETPTETAYALNFQTFNGSGRRKGATILGGLMMIPQQFTNANQRIQLTITIGDTPYMVYAGLSPAAGGAPNGWRAGEVVTYTISSSSLPQLYANTLELSSTAVTVNENKTKTVSVTTNTSGGTLSVESADPTIATATISGSTITIKGLKPGTTTVTVRSAEKGMYAAASKTITVTVEEYTDNAPANAEAVDLGLSVLWANMNVGATKVTDYGLYVMWGETTGYISETNYAKYDFSWSTYKWYSSGKITKYNSTDGKMKLDDEDDAAVANWGGTWRMATADEFQELLNNTQRTWQTNYNSSGINGYLYTSKKAGYTNKSIFLPAGGWRGGTGFSRVGSSGCYACSTRGSSEYNDQYLYMDYIHEDSRCDGLMIRAVQPK